MNYKPFSAIACGDIFNMVTLPDVPLMKTDKNTGIYLKGVWVGDKLYSRGAKAHLESSTCIICPEATELTIPITKVDPLDPSRKFWKDADQAFVGQNSRVPVNVFAGLFLYSGLGVGTYYSSVDSEVFFMNATDARKRAKDENIPFVNFDSFNWTSDPTLARQREQAREAFEREAASAVAEAA